MMNEAPINFAPAVAHKTDRSLRKNRNRIADVNVRRFRAAESSRSDVREQHHLFVGQFVWNFRQVRLRVRDKQIFGLRAVDGVAESPAADRFDTFAVAALRPLRGQTSAALAAGRDRADQNAIADFVSGQSFAQFFDHADRFVSDHQSRFHRVFAAQNVQVGPADGGERDANDRFANAGMRSRHFFDAGYCLVREKRWLSFFALSILLLRRNPFWARRRNLQIAVASCAATAGFEKQAVAPFAYASASTCSSSSRVITITGRSSRNVLIALSSVIP